MLEKEAEHNKNAVIMLEKLRYTGSAHTAHRESPSTKTNSHLGEDRQTPSCTSCTLAKVDELGQ